MTNPTAIPLAAVIGIDWADQQHDISLQATGASAVENTRIAHTPEALGDWLAQLQRRFGGAPVGVAIETSRGPLIHALMDHEFIVLYPVNPRSLRRFREAFTPSGAKDDLPDAQLLRELLLKHRDRLRAWLPDDAETRALRRLGQSRRKLVDLGTQLTQQLRAALKEYFPQALTWAGEDLTSPLACDFLLKWPTLQALGRARPHTVRKFYYAHNCRRGDRIEQRLQEMQNATPLTRDPAITDTGALLVQSLARQIKTLTPSITRFDEEIAQRFAAHPDADLFASLPGSGSALAPRLLAFFGSNRTRFSAADDVQKLSAIAPVTVRSGNQCSVHYRWPAPTYDRQTFHEFAQHSIRFCDWARVYYELQRERGKSHHAAVRALAFKWIRIIWRCWKDRSPYDDARYLQSLIRRRSPIAARVMATAA